MGTGTMDVKHGGWTQRRVNGVFSLMLRRRTPHYTHTHTHTHTYIYIQGWAEKFNGWKAYTMTSYLLLVNFFLTKHWNTDGSGVWTARGIILINKRHLVLFHSGILVSLWIFQLTLVYIYIDVSGFKRTQQSPPDMHWVLIIHTIKSNIHQYLPILDWLCVTAIYFQDYDNEICVRVLTEWMKVFSELFPLLNKSTF